MTTLYRAEMTSVLVAADLIPPRDLASVDIRHVRRISTCGVPAKAATAASDTDSTADPNMPAELHGWINRQGQGRSPSPASSSWEQCDARSGDGSGSTPLVPTPFWVPIPSRAPRHIRSHNPSNEVGPPLPRGERWERIASEPIRVSSRCRVGEVGRRHARGVQVADQLADVIGDRLTAVGLNPLLDDLPHQR